MNRIRYAFATALFLYMSMTTPAIGAEIQGAFNLSTLTFIGSNPARLSFYNTKHSDGEEEVTLGGSMKEAQRGIDAHINLQFEETSTYRIPIGVEYLICSAYEMQNYRSMRNITAFKTDIITIYSGLHKIIWNYPEYDISLYTGLELRGTYFHNIYYDNYNKKDGEILARANLTPKDNALRLGATARFGGEGKLYKDFYIGWSGGLTCMNLIGRDADRGELMTPEAFYENHESLLFGYNINVGIFYKFKK